jgi:OmpA family
MRRIARKDAGVRRRAEPKARDASHVEPAAAEAERGRGDFLSTAGIMQLQRTAGNAAVAALLRSVAIGDTLSRGQAPSSGPSEIARSLTGDLLRGRMPGAEVAGVQDTSSVSRFVEPIGGQQPGSGGTFDWDVEAKLQYPGQNNVDAIKFAKDNQEQPFGQVLVPEQDPQFASRGSGRGQVTWNLTMKWDFGARLSQAALAGSAIPTTAGFIPAPTPNLAGAPEVALGASQDAKGEAHVTVVAPFNVQHAAYDKPLSGSAKQRNQSEQQGEAAPGGPMRSDRSKISVVWGQPRTTEMSSVGKGGQLLGAQPQTDSSDDGGSVTISPQLQMQSQVAEAAQGSTSTSAGVLGFGSQSQTSAQFQQQMNDTQSMTRSFTADVKVPPPETLAPKTKFEGVSGAVGPFGVDSDRLPSNAEENISEWYLGEKAFEGPDGTQPAISSGARELIEAGQVEMRVTGHASATASFAHNRDLSRRRADKVTSILKDLGGSGIKINQRALGKAKTRTKPGAPKEDAAERRVQIEFQADVPDDPNMAHTQNASDVENG